MAFYQTVSYRVRRENLERCRRVLEEFVNYIKEEEPGTLLYIALQDEADETRLLHFYVFENEEAKALHQRSPVVARLFQALEEFSEGPVEVRSYRLVASDGLW